MVNFVSVILRNVLPSWRSWFGRAFVLPHTVRQQHTQSRTRMLVCKYMDRNGSAIKLATKRSAGVTPDVYLRNLLDADDEAHKQGNPPCLWNPGQMSPKQDIRGHTKRTDVLHIFIWNKYWEILPGNVGKDITFAPHFRDIPDKPCTVQWNWS